MFLCRYIRKISIQFLVEKKLLYEILVKLGAVWFKLKLFTVTCALARHF